MDTTTFGAARLAALGAARAHRAAHPAVPAGGNIDPARLKAVMG
jgi:hypothetical protein